jgi:hypothetical protein
MEVNLEMVHRVFSDVLDGRMTREAADRWAYGVKQQFEAGSLTYSPATAEDRIWEGVMYLFGIDIMESPGEYLHTDEDIRLAMIAILDR